MATKTTVRHLDDVERSKGRDVEATRPETHIGLDGRAYEIDLSEKNYQQLCEKLAPFIAAARRARVPAQRTGSGSRPRPRPSEAREENQAIRAWAQQNGFTVSERGRLPVNVTEAYERREEQPRNGRAVRAELAPEPAPAPAPAPAPEPEPEPVEAPAPEPERADERVVHSTGGKGRIARIAARVAAEAAAQRPTFASKGEMNKAVREWATGKGMPMAARGKVPSDVMAQYVREHGEPVIP